MLCFFLHFFLSPKSFTSFSQRQVLICTQEVAATEKPTDLFHFPLTDLKLTTETLTDCVGSMFAHSALQTIFLLPF